MNIRMYDLILKKKHGGELSDSEISEMIAEYTEGNIPDYQMSALLMAICFKGMSDREISALTSAVADSGDTVDLSEFGDLSVDKHSTGGVGDKTTLVIAPMAAAMGLKVAKMSGRGLGHTGGTVDKLESFPGYATSLSPEEFFDAVRRVGVCVTGQSGNLAPADKKLYALRDVTATVDSVPLITSSVMGKKLASGAKTIVLDVKYGSGSFMKTPEEARVLAEKMVNIGKLCGRSTAALITNMDTPLGYAIGNSLEVKEAIDTLLGRGPSDLTELCTELSALMAQKALKISYEDAKNAARGVLNSGKAYEKFKEWIAAQGGDTSYIDEPERFPKASVITELAAEKDGYIYKTDAELIGIAAATLGAGRRTKEECIDHSAGILLKKKTGDYVRRGEVIGILCTNRPECAENAKNEFLSAITFSDTPPAAVPLIYEIV